MISATGLTITGSATNASAFGGSGAVSRAQPTTVNAIIKLSIFFITEGTSVVDRQKLAN